MDIVRPHTLSGFMELLPAPQVQMDKIIQKLGEAYSLYGFTPLDTPVLESAEVLLAKGGGETEKQVYSFLKGDRELAMRFDLTVPLAKYVAMNYSKLQFPFRRYQIGKVYRGERAQRGRFREFYQADIDIIGDGELGILADAEIPAIIYKAFSSLGLRRFKILVNNRKLLSGFFEIIGITEKSGAIMRCIDKLEKAGEDFVRGLLSEEGLPPEKIDEIFGFISISGSNAERLSELKRRYHGKSDLFDRGFDELSVMVSHLDSFGVPKDVFDIDLTIARGLDYYTGTVYETKMIDCPEIGSICSGGRYDDLASFYTNKKLPGVGISIGLTRLFYVLEDMGYLNEDFLTSPADVLVIPMSDDMSFAISAASMLRDYGMRTQLYTEKKKLGAKLTYAAKLGIPFALIIGEDEIAANTVTVKNLATGEQQTNSPMFIMRMIKSELNARNRGFIIKDK